MQKGTIIPLKIAIITQPLTNNYGGILQNYALQKVLQRMGHDVTTLNVERKKVQRELNLHYFLSVIKRFVQKYFLQDRTLLFIEAHKQVNFVNAPQKYQQRFIDENIKIVNVGSDPLTENNDTFDGYVVGSDQVWRPCFATNLPNCYLDFVKNASAKRVAYAVSFGVDNWETDDSSTAVISELAKKFDAISVREQSGIALCRDFLGVNAIQVIDPTMMLGADDYRKLYKKHTESKTKGEYISVYILDKSPETKKVIRGISEQLDLPVKYLGEGFDSIENWLEGIDNAKYVVTDSFHGSVFSILFNKQFVALGNMSRGQTRFENLFSMFALSNRLVSSTDEATSSLQKKINYEVVNDMIAQSRVVASVFLKKQFENAKYEES